MEDTGRYAIPELFKLRDRNDREFVLPATHEETVTFHARELQSYRDLPQMLYHFQNEDGTSRARAPGSSVSGNSS